MRFVPVTSFFVSLYILTFTAGRCGEWAQAFALLCRSLHFDVRFIVDFTDHVWVELWNEQQLRWIHCDPCENVRDAPLLYEKGWGKKLTYVLAFSVDGIREVTKRYTADYEALIPRRVEVEETFLADLISEMNAVRRSLMEEEECTRAIERDLIEDEQFLIANQTSAKLKEEEKRSRISGQ